MKLTRQQLQAFWNKVDRRGKDDCWEWKGGTQSKGYGSFGMNGKTYLAHRISFLIANGYMPRLLLLHSCDNRKCCNPNHLREGTHLENVRDMWSKGRARPVGTPRKLTPKQVIAIRQTKGTRKQVARIFGVHPTMISQIVNNKVWRTLD